MLIRQTVLYLPAQLLPAVAQFVSLAVWSHYASAEVIGIVTLVVSIQEFLVLGLMGFWTAYTVRFTSRVTDEAGARAMRQTSGPVVFAATALQALIAVTLYITLIDHHPRWYLLPIIMVVVGGRAFNSYQAERARVGGDILLYSIESTSGPVVGMLAGVPLLMMFGSDELWIFLGYAIAQIIAAVIGIARDRSWISLGPPDPAILRHAMAYGLPLIVSAGLIWITQNVGRLDVGYNYGLAAAGVYSLGFGLGFRAAAMAAMAVVAAAFPLAVRYKNAGDHDGAMRQLSANAVLLLAALASSMTGLALLAGDILHLFVAPRMAVPAYPIMLWAILAGTAYCFRQHFLSQIFLLSTHTRTIAVVCAVETLCCVVATLVVVPLWGATGAIVTLALICVGTMSSMLVMSTRTGFKIPWADFARVALATGVMAAGVSATPPAHNIVTLLLRVATGGGVFALVFACLYRQRLLRMVNTYRRQIPA